MYALCAWAGGVLSGGGEGFVVHWSPGASDVGRVVARVGQPVVSLCAVAVPGLSAKLAVGTLAGDLFWVEPGGVEAPRRWRLHEDGLFGLVQVGKSVVAVGGKGRLSTWSAAAGTMERVVQLDTVRLRGLAYLRTPGLLAVGTANGDVHLVDPASLRIVHTLALAHERTVFSIADGGAHFFTAGRDGAVRAWSTAAPFAQLAHVAAHGATVNALALRSDRIDGAASGALVSVGRDREVRVWGFHESAMALRKVLNAPRDGGHPASVNAACWLPGGLVTGGDDRVVRYWATGAGT